MNTSKFVEVKAAIQAADSLFHRAANAWVRGNNSGDGATLERMEKLCDSLRDKAEAILLPHGVTVSYPGLFPMWKYNEREYFTADSIINALEHDLV